MMKFLSLLLMIPAFIFVGLTLVFYICGYLVYKLAAKVDGRQSLLTFNWCFNDILEEFGIDD